MIKILKFIQLDKGALRGSLDVEIEKWGNFVIHGISLFQKDGKRWISFPGQKSNETDSSGRHKFYSHCRFREREMMDKFCHAVCESLGEWLKTNQPTLPQPKPNYEAPAYGPGSNNTYENEPPSEVPF